MLISVTYVGGTIYSLASVYIFILFVKDELALIFFFSSR